MRFKNYKDIIYFYEIFINFLFLIFYYLFLEYIEVGEGIR